MNGILYNMSRTKDDRSEAGALSVRGYLYVRPVRQLFYFRITEFDDILSDAVIRKKTDKMILRTAKTAVRFSSNQMKGGGGRMDDVKGPDTPECFERLVSEYQTQLRRLCCVLLKDVHLAEDAVQETFLKAYRSMGEIRKESSERTWLTRIAVNTCRDLLRSRWFRHIDRSVKIEDLPEPEAPADLVDTGLYETILRLPVKQREVVLLYFYQNMTMQEVSDILQISVSNVSRRLESARKTLRKKLEEGGTHE